MKKIFLAYLLISLFSIQLSAQIKSISFQASGLTCSMCSNSVYKSLQTLPFVKKINVQLKEAIFNLELVPDKKVDLDAIAKKVKSVGFSISKLEMVVNFKKETIENDSHIVNDALNFHFMNISKQVITGDKKLLLIDKNFTTAKEFKKYKTFTKMECYNSGFMQNCCTAKTAMVNNAKTRIFHVTIL